MKRGKLPFNLDLHFMCVESNARIAGDTYPVDEYNLTSSGCHAISIVTLLVCFAVPLNLYTLFKYEKMIKKSYHIDQITYFATTILGQRLGSVIFNDTQTSLKT